MPSAPTSVWIPMAFVRGKQLAISQRLSASGRPKTALSVVGKPIRGGTFGRPRRVAPTSCVGIHGFRRGEHCSPVTRGACSWESYPRRQFRADEGIRPYKVCGISHLIANRMHSLELTFLQKHILQISFRVNNNLNLAIKRAH